jgi:hypothetical protein
VFVLVKNYCPGWAVKGISRGVHRADQQLWFPSLGRGARIGRRHLTKDWSASVDVLPHCVPAELMETEIFRLV